MRCSVLAAGTLHLRLETEYPGVSYFLASIALLCPPGTYSASGASDAGCTPCPVGQYGDEAGVTSPACSGPCAVREQDLYVRVCSRGSTRPDGMVVVSHLPSNFPLLDQPLLTVITVGDLDGDGDLDLVGLNESASALQWSRNLGPTAGFGPPTTIATPNFAADVAVVDLDGDAALDLVALVGSQLVWLFNTAESPPRFVERPCCPPLPAPEVSSGRGKLKVADVAVDGLSPSSGLLVVHARNVTWYPFDSAGAAPSRIRRQLQTAAPIVIPVAVSSTQAFSTGDLDGDGDTDFVALDSVADAIVWFENHGGAPPVLVRHFVFASSDGQVEVSDVDGDGDLDICASEMYVTRLTWYQNAGGAPLVWSARPLLRGSLVSGFAVADIDVDGDADFVVAFSSSLVVLVNDGDPIPAFTRSSLGIVTGQVFGLLLVDVNGDGTLDVQTGSRTWLPNPMCPPGTYGPLGLAPCVPCGAGYVGSRAGLGTEQGDACQGLCPPGKYSRLGWDSCGPCQAGYVCGAGATAPNATVCPRGRFSVQGASECSLCPAGRYGADEVSAALPCACWWYVHVWQWAAPRG